MILKNWMLVCLKENNTLIINHWAEIKKVIKAALDSILRRRPEALNHPDPSLIFLSLLISLKINMKS